MSQTHRVHARGDRLWTRAGTADGADEPVSSTSPAGDDAVTSKTDKPAGGIIGWWRDYNARVKDMASQIKALGLAGFTA